MGITTLVDLDLTDLFFSLYKYDDYFQIDKYNPERYKEYIQRQLEQNGERKEFVEQHLQKVYGSPIYEFYPEETPKLKNKRLKNI